MNQSTNEKCRKCKVKAETIDHTVGGCTTLAVEEYTDRHNNVAQSNPPKSAYALLYDEEPYYRYTPDNVVEDEHTKLLWNWSIQTDKLIQSNVPDLVLIEKQ